MKEIQYIEGFWKRVRYIIQILMNVKCDEINISVRNTCLKQNIDLLRVIRIENRKTMPKHTHFWFDVYDLRL